MRTSEWVVVGYLLYLLATAVVLRVRSRAFGRLAILAGLTCALLVLLAFNQPSRVGAVLRDWLPGAYVMLGYWGTGLLYRRPDTALEARLEALDTRLFALLGPLASRLPSLVREVLEAAYLCCYPLVPAGMAVLYVIGARPHADSYWTLVLVSAFAAYGVLPWAATRPPRALETGAGPSGPRPCGPSDLPRYFFQRVNLVVLDRGSIQVNTFPSGHAASAWAVALFMTTVPGAPWVVFALFAGAICAGAVVGRYHYGLDVVAGTGVAIAAFALLP